MKSLKFTLIELLVVCVIIMIIGTIVIVAGAFIVGGCYLSSEIHEEGLKPTVERVWEGPKSDSETGN